MRRKPPKADTGPAPPFVLHPAAVDHAAAVAPDCHVARVRRHMTWLSHASLVLGATLSVACARDPAAPGGDTSASAHLGGDAATYWPDVVWRTARPIDVDVDGARITALLDRLRRGEFGAVHALIVVRKGYVIVDTTIGG